MANNLIKLMIILPVLTQLYLICLCSKSSSHAKYFKVSKHNLNTVIPHTFYIEYIPLILSSLISLMIFTKSVIVKVAGLIGIILMKVISWGWFAVIVNIWEISDWIAIVGGIIALIGM